MKVGNVTAEHELPPVSSPVECHSAVTLGLIRT
jgi:hypothetical protein